MTTERNKRQMTLLRAYKLKLRVTIKIHKLPPYQNNINSFKKVRFKDSRPIRNNPFVILNDKIILKND